MEEEHQPGAVVNGHFLGQDNEWHPLSDLSDAGSPVADPRQEQWPSGWYPDPHQTGQQRYWDGSAWTEHVAPDANAHRGLLDPMADTSHLHGKAQQALNKELSTGETPLVVIIGASHQATIGTDRRVFVYKKGFMAGASFGSELTSFSYQHLTGVQVHTGMMTGAVILQGSGLLAISTSYWKTGDADPFKSPNAIPLSRPFDEVQLRAAKLRGLIDDVHRPEASSAPSGSAAVSVADEIRKLAEMRRDGLISETEFEQMKSHLLAGGP